MLNHRRFLPLVLMCLLAGCAGLGSRSYPPLADASVELADTPFYPQTRQHCGPAALATVLDVSGTAAPPDVLAPELFVPERGGTFQVELLSATRRRDRLAVIVGADSASLVRQLQAGRPVLVLQNLGLSYLPAWHYAVVVGYDPQDDSFLLRSGTTRRLTMSRRRFESTWQGGDRWGFVVLRPQQLPEGLEETAYLESAAGLEATGHYESALEAFDSALTVWPDTPLAMLGRANNLYRLQRFGEAEAAYRALLEVDPQHQIAAYNLITLLLEQQRPCSAAAVLTALDDPDVSLFAELSELGDFSEDSRQAACAPAP